MSMSMLKARLAQADRQDGYSGASAAAVCQFQAWAEGQPGCDYQRLRAVLLAARGRSCSLEQLIALYRQA